MFYVKEKGVVGLNLKELFGKPRRGWGDNIKRVPNGIGCEGKAWFT